MIPKIIHYCWFGRNKKSDLVERCIASWKKYCPDYEIIEWNEDNFDVNCNAYCRYCYENKKWAYLSDLVRLMVVYEHGGIYFDTDVEVVQSFDDVLKMEAFFAFENNENVATGLGFGSILGHKTVKAMIEQYKEIELEENGTMKLLGCPQLNTKALLQFGLVLNGKKQYAGGALILPCEYMNPYDDPTGVLHKTKNTLSIHWYSKSALDKWTILRSKLTRPFHRIFGVTCFKWLKGKK